MPGTREYMAPRKTQKCRGRLYVVDDIRYCVGEKNITKNRRKTIKNDH